LWRINILFAFIKMLSTNIKVKLAQHNRVFSMKHSRVVHIYTHSSPKVDHQTRTNDIIKDIRLSIQKAEACEQVNCECNNIWECGKAWEALYDIQQILLKYEQQAPVVVPEKEIIVKPNAWDVIS
jgi:hypothetical protein